MKSLKSIFMRGGTSKALMIRADDLPADRSLWDGLFLQIMGSPDSYRRQLNGMGGGVSSLSKIAVISVSERSDADVDYTFVQVGIDSKTVDYKGNCGNISSAVGPFAVESGLFKLPDGQHLIRIFNTNTQKIIHSSFAIKDGRPDYHGNVEISGVSGRGVDVELSFLNPAGATTGELYPGGHKVYRFTMAEFEKVVNGLALSDNVIHAVRKRFNHFESMEVWSLDVANACYFIEARDLGIEGTESPEVLNQDKELLAFVDIIRTWMSVKMKIASSYSEAYEISTVPYGVIFSNPSNYRSTDGELIRADKFDILCRAVAGKKIHQSYPLTVSLCTAAFTALRSKEAFAKESLRVKLGMPAGIIELGLNVDFSKLQNQPLEAMSKGMFYRSAKILMGGEVYYD